MAAAARIGIDRILTGHGCSMTASILGAKNFKVFIGPVATAGAVATDLIAPHAITGGTSCVVHPTAIINTGSTRVFYGVFPAARVGDSADFGVIISGSFKVFIGG
jgi:uncharacterized Zn-binding protein involved in type VI secretion